MLARFVGEGGGGGASRQHGSPPAYAPAIQATRHGLMRQAQMPETICANVVMHLEGLGLYHAACLQLRGERINAIACLSSSGILAVESIRGTVNGETFFDFLRGTLIPQMMPFNGSNPHSILVMDNNCSIHHTHEVKDLLNQAGVLALYLPPYSLERRRSATSSLT